MIIADASKFYVGSGQVNKIYLGSTQLWSGGYDVDAQAYFDRITANSGTIGTSAKTAINNFVVGLKADGTWSLCNEIGIFVGVDQLAAALVKLKDGTAGVSPKLVASSIVAGDYIASGATAGIKGDGSSKYLSTGLNLNAAGYTQTNTHISAYYTPTTDAGYRIIIGSDSGAARNAGTYIGKQANGFEVAKIGASATSDVTNGTSQRGHILAATNGSSTQTLYVAGASLSTTVAATPAFANVPVYILCRARGTTPAGVTTADFSARYVRGYSIGSGMSATQASTFYSRWQTLMTAFSANV